MSTLKQINKPISSEMAEFEKYFKSALDTNIPLLRIIIDFLYRRKGKQLRPMLVFLSAKLLGEINQSTYTAASMIELLHTATLVHDDVVDEAYERRGFFSINALWKSKVAVLVGDYILSKGLLLSVKNKEYDLLEIMSEAVKEMSEGELYQIEKARKLDITEDDYFEIIRKKTASLIASCTANGAKSVKASEESIADLKQFGEYLGIAFQIRDDLFDYSNSKKIGKPTGNDIKEKKMTLPLIFTLNNIDHKSRRKVIKTIKRNNNNAQKVQEIISLVKSTGGLEYSEQKMNDYKVKALNILEKYPNNEAKESLKILVEYATTRKK